MALTVKYLKSIGLNEEQIEGIIEGHKETIEGYKRDIEAFKADSEKLKEVQRELDDLKKGNDYKKLYEDEKAAHSKTKNDYAAKETAATNERLFRARLTEIGITGKRADQILKMTDLSAFEVENGAYKDAAAVDTHIRTEWSEFVPEKGKKGADVPNPPQNTGGKMTKEQIAAIKDPTERRAAIANNMDAFERSN